MHIWANWLLTPKMVATSSLVNSSTRIASRRTIWYIHRRYAGVVEVEMTVRVPEEAVGEFDDAGGRTVELGEVGLTTLSVLSGHLGRRCDASGGVRLKRKRFPAGAGEPPS
jgi:hypothetical protein